VSLTVFQDGLIANNRSSTEHGDEFLNDALEWMKTDMGAVDHNTISIKRIYLSEMFVSLERPLAAVNPRFDAFAKLLASTIKSTAQDLRVDAGGISFWIDPSLKTQQAHFRVERADNAAFAENRYFAGAPLETEIHLQALARFEEILQG
jgi:hypothetical protein